MKVTRTNTLTGIEHTIDIPMTEEEFYKAFKQWRVYNQYIQNAFPSLSSAQQAFIKDGITPKEWDGAFKEDS